MGLLIRGGWVLDEHGNPTRQDVLVANGRIAALGLALPDAGCTVVDAEGLLVLPGLVDLHVHLREPGFEAKETIATGTRAAACGGFTTVACMPNTRPPLDRPELVRWVRAKAEREGAARVLPFACITRGQAGRALADFRALRDAGALAITDDGRGVQDAAVMRAAMREAARLGLVVAAHCEDEALAGAGVVHDGAFARRWGLPGIPASAEAVHVARDIALAMETGCRYHALHLSAKESVALVRQAKALGVPVTAEVTPHHLLLCDADIPAPDANWKMNPPLRSREDREALIEGLLDGTIDFIATDHAPHTAEEKVRDLAAAPFGIVGLETAFPLLYTHLVETGICTLKQLVDWLTVKPARAYGLPYGRLAVGAAADLTLVDREAERAVDPAAFASKGRNTPFAGWRLKGWPVLTMLEGRVTWQDPARFALPAMRF
nr:dihydroorotase [Bacillota bacterium]